MSTTSAHMELSRLEAALDATVDETRIAVVNALEASLDLQPLVELTLCRALSSMARQHRLNAAVGLQAVTVFWSAETGQRRSISPSTFGALVGALAVESEVTPRVEQLWALSRQDYLRGELKPYAPVAARIFSAFVTTPAQVTADLVGQLAYAYESIRPMIDEPDLPLELVAAPRDLLGYAATGIPFILSEPRNPKLVLIFNDNLGLWLPPGGHFNPGMEEIPSEALIQKIRDETGAHATVIWNGQEFNPRDGHVTVSPAPSFVLLEDLTSLAGRSSTEIHARHYDLNYICEIEEYEVSDDCLVVELGGTPRADPFTFVRERIEARAREHRREPTQILDDVVERVVLSLDVLGRRDDSRALFRYELVPPRNGNGLAARSNPRRVEQTLVILGDGNGNGNGNPST